ncbi:hypothetical protein WR25_15573 [Diploscapter pachys]|uniref:Uncharacterized protein n=1 Tax=Diploscapter pachys TaxID=2018661 RepID=A0A2A2M5D7_9BILA|nr:hypothetical protein WR25_15573 [Diploscapter pachys]
MPRFCVVIAAASSPRPSRREMVGSNTPVGGVDVRDGAGRQQARGKRGRHDEVDLHRARTRGGRADQRHQPLHIGPQAGQLQAQRHARPAAGIP